MDAEFFRGFTADLHNKDAWIDFHTSFRTEKKKLKDTANPSQLGDNVSLKAEKATSAPTEHDKGAQHNGSRSTIDVAQSTKDSMQGTPSLSKLAEDTTIGDPISLESEDIVESPIRSTSTSSLTSKATKPMTSPQRPEISEPCTLQMPSINGEDLLWTMMSASREPDPYIFPALERLSKLKTRPVLGALSNTVIYPPDHPWSKPSRPLSSLTTTVFDTFAFDPSSFFDVYVASALVGMRKPSRDIYQLAVHRLDAYDREQGGDGIQAKDVVYLDDIGENLKTGKLLGMKTIRVQLGKTWRAVKELEAALGGGIELMDQKTRRSKL